MRLVAFVEYAAVLIGVLAIIAGRFFGIAKGFQLGVFLVGAGFAFAGLAGLFTRRMAFRPHDDAFESYAGLPAAIVGLMALALGAAAIGSAYLIDMGQWHASAQNLMRRPAPLLGTAGLFLIGFGVLALLNPQERHTWLWRIFVYAPRATLGILMIAAGVAAIGMGGWEWLEPKAFDDFVASLPRRLELLF